MNKPVKPFNLDDILLDLKSTTTPATMTPKKADESSAMPTNSGTKKADQVEGSKKPEVKTKGLKPKSKSKFFKEVKQITLEAQNSLPEEANLSAKSPGLKKPMDIFVKICFEATVALGSDMPFISKIVKLENLAKATVKAGVPLTEESCHNLDKFFEICHFLSPTVILNNPKFLSLLQRHAAINPDHSLTENLEAISHFYGGNLSIKFESKSNLLKEIVEGKMMLKNIEGTAYISGSENQTLESLLTRKLEKILLYKVLTLCPLDAKALIRIKDLSGIEFLAFGLERRSHKSPIFTQYDFENILGNADFPLETIHSIRKLIECNNLEKNRAKEQKLGKKRRLN